VGNREEERYRKERFIKDEQDGKRKEKRSWMFLFYL
jgi:hypothetical protein